MAVAAYYAWVRDGRPIVPAQPVQDFVTTMKVGYPHANPLFSWYADEAHYLAEPPQDHTPYSVTGWPLANPYPYVFATDIMHRPDLGVDCFKLFAYWLAEARSGRMPWLKYMIWQAKRYDVRNSWQPVGSSGHFDHIHLSARTDHRTTHLGSWSPILGDDMLTTDDLAAIKKAVWYTDLDTGTRVISAGTALLGIYDRAALPADLSGRLDAILAAALDDGDMTVVLPPDAIAELTALRDAVAALPGAVADEEAARLAE